MSNAYLGKVGTVSPLSYLPLSYPSLYACGCYAPYLRDELIVTVCTTSTTQFPFSVWLNRLQPSLTPRHHLMTLQAFFWLNLCAGCPLPATIVSPHMYGAPAWVLPLALQSLVYVYAVFTVGDHW